MNTITRILLPGVTAGLVILFSGSAIYLYNTIQPIPEITDSVYAAYHAETAAMRTAANTESSAEPENPLLEAATDTAYLVKLQDDRLYVFAEGSREPSAIYDLPAGWLPDYDRILLEYGFRVSNEAELRELLEDYIS